MKKSHVFIFISIFILYILFARIKSTYYYDESANVLYRDKPLSISFTTPSSYGEDATAFTSVIIYVIKTSAWSTTANYPENPSIQSGELLGNIYTTQSLPENTGTDTVVTITIPDTSRNGFEIPEQKDTAFGISVLNNKNYRSPTSWIVVNKSRSVEHSQSINAYRTNSGKKCTGGVENSSIATSDAACKLACNKFYPQCKGYNWNTSTNKCTIVTDTTPLATTLSASDTCNIPDDQLKASKNETCIPLCTAHNKDMLRWIKENANFRKNIYDPAYASYNAGGLLYKRPDLIPGVLAELDKKFATVNPMNPAAKNPKPTEATFKTKNPNCATEFRCNEPNMSMQKAAQSYGQNPGDTTSMKRINDYKYTI